MKQKTAIRTIVLCAAAALLVLVVGLALSGGSEAQVVERYYAAMYVPESGGMEAILDCLAPDLRTEYYNNVTMGGVSFHQLGSWQLEAINLVGDQVKVAIDILSTGPDSASALAQLRQQYAGAEQAHTVSFQLTLTGEQDTAVFLGTLPMVRIEGQWYLLNSDAGLTRGVNDE